MDDEFGNTSMRGMVASYYYKVSDRSVSVNLQQAFAISVQRLLSLSMVCCFGGAPQVRVRIRCLKQLEGPAKLHLAEQARTSLP